MNQKIKAAIFDAGGVITEWRETINNFLAEMKVDWVAFQKATAPDEVAAYKGLIKMEDHFKQSMKRLGMEEKWPRWAELVPTAFTRIEPTFELLEELQGKIRLALLSNAYAGSLDQLDNKTKHKKYFEVIIDSSVVGMAKPEKEIYLLACKKLGLGPKDCLYIDDTKEYIAAARQLGFQTVHFTDPKESVKLIRKILYGSV